MLHPDGQEWNENWSSEGSTDWQGFQRPLSSCVSWVQHLLLGVLCQELNHNVLLLFQPLLSWKTLPFLCWLGNLLQLFLSASSFLWMHMIWRPNQHGSMNSVFSLALKFDQPKRTQNSAILVLPVVKSNKDFVRCPLPLASKVVDTYFGLAIFCHKCFWVVLARIVWTSKVLHWYLSPYAKDSFCICCSAFLYKLLPIWESTNI